MAREHRLEISDRHIWLAITTMIQESVAKAAIEFITNSDDSYARLEANGYPTTGRIVFDILDRRSPSDLLEGRSASDYGAIRITDDAEGFSAEDLERKFGRMGENTSGLAAGLDVRGFFGDGLKEGVLGLGVGGTIVSIRDNHVAQARLWWKDSTPVFRLEELRPVTMQIRRELDLAGNGTVLTVDLGPKVRVPRHLNLVEELRLHAALRDIVQNPGRRLTVRRLGANGRTLHSTDVTYRDPVVDPSFTPVELQGVVPGYAGSDFKIHVSRAKEELTGPEEGMQRIGGLLVQSKRALVDITMFGNENKPGTEFLFGRLICDHLYERLRQNDIVVKKDRTGLARDNDFVKKLGAEVDRLLEPIIRHEAERSASERTPEDAQTRKRLDEARRELNKIAKDELEASGTGEDINTVPFRFEHAEYHIYLREARTVRLIVNADVLSRTETVEVMVAGEGVSATPTTVTLDPADAVAGVVVTDITLLGSAVTEDGRLSATLGAHNAEAKLAVRERELPASPFGFERDNYRVAVGHWGDLALKINVPLALTTEAEVTVAVEKGNVQIRPEATRADPREARGEWVTVHLQVMGDQVGIDDVVIATMNGREARAHVVIATKRKTPERDPKGGLIKDIQFNDSRENPPQRTVFRDGVITIYVNEPGIRRYLRDPEERTRPLGRALTADLVLQAFCRQLASRKHESVFGGGDIGNSVDAVLHLCDRLMKTYGERIHAIVNPPR